MALPGFGPPSLPVGTEVSAKYRGAFCEAKVKTVVRVVKCKVMMKDCQASIFITDEEIKGPVKLGAVVEVKHPDTGQPVEATINKLIDHSTYTVVFDDGDERTLRRSQLCLKGDKHFIESETLDNLPLSHPEHFGTPVLQNKKAKRKNEDESDDDDEDGSEEESPRRAMYRGRHQELVGKLMLVDLPQRKGSAIPALVVLPDANSLSEVKSRDQILVRSFKDSKFLTVTRKDLKDFTRAVAIKNDDKTMRTAFEKALLYHDTKELPVGWDREELLGSDIDDDDGDDGEDEYASEDEPYEEKDRFVAQLYKFMDDRGTPINKGPCVGNKDLNLYKLFKIVQTLGGYNKVTKEMKWPVVYSKMGLPSLHQNPAHQIRTAYKKYLDAYETFYRKLGSTMGTLSRPGRGRQNSGRSILSFRAREKSPRSPKPPEKSKEDTDSMKQKPEISAEKPEDNQDAISIASTDDSDVITRRTPRREARLQSSREDSKEKKEESGKAKKDDKKEEVTKNKKDEKKEEAPAPKSKKEEAPVIKSKKEEIAPALKAKKDEPVKGKKEEETLKKEERKSARKVKGEEEKEPEKEEKKPVRGAKKEKEEEKKEEPKQEAVAPVKDSPKKRVTRRKLLPTEVKKEAEVKEEPEEKKEPPRKTVVKETKPVEKKEKEIPRTLERRDSRTSDKKENNTKLAEKKEVKPAAAEKKVKEVKGPEEKKPPKKEKKLKEPDDQTGSDDNDEEVDSEGDDKSDSSVKHDYPIGSKLRVKYGRGKNQKIYIAKVVDFGRDGAQKTYLVHYAGWNTRYDEWIRPDRVVSVLDKPDWDKAKMPPARPPPLPGSTKRIPASPLPTAVTKKSPPSLKKSVQIFRTPKKIVAKTRATRSSSSDTSVTSKKTDKRMTRRRSNLTDSTGSKSPESHLNSDVDDTTGSERADDDDNTKDDKDDDDDILDVEEDDDKAENESVTEKSADMDTSAEEDGGPKIESSSEMGSERVEEEEEEEPEPGKEIRKKDGKEAADVDQSKAKSQPSEDIKLEEELKKEVRDSPIPDVVNEPVSKPANELAKNSGTPDVKQERATVVVAEVSGAVDEIKSAVYQDEDCEEEVNASDIKESASTSAMPDDSIDNDCSESPRLEIVEEREPEEKDLGSEKLESKSPECDESTAPILIADQGIPQLKKMDMEPEKKDKEAEKPKGGRGRKKDAAKDSKKSVRTLDMSGTSIAPEIPTLEPMIVPSVSSGSKVEPSPYDFDAEVDTPWHPEITKKWEPNQKAPVVMKECKESLASAEESDEKEKKKVKKKTKKKPISPEFVVGEEGSSSTVDDPVTVSANTSDETLTAAGSGEMVVDKQGPKKKGRKRKELSSETKKEVIEQYESTVNSVVEAVKHSLKETESDQEQRPVVKRRRVKRVSESDKKDVTMRVGKMGRKVASRDSLDVLDSVSAEADKTKQEKVPASQIASQNEATSSQYLQSFEAVGASTSSAQPEEVPAPKDRKEPGFPESQDSEPQVEPHDAGAPFDNTPPTTPEYEEEGNSNAAMQHQQNSYHPDDLSSKTDMHKDSAKVLCSSSATSSISLPASSNLAPSKSASESPSDNDVISTTSTDNLDTTLIAHQSESSGTDQDVPSTKKRKAADDTLNGMAGPKKKKRVHGTRSRTARKSPKYSGNSDSQGSASNTPNHCPESPPNKLADLTKSPRPSKFNFNADLGEYLEGEARCNFLIGKMREIKAIYMNLKSEVASIDRRRKRARRKERESSQVSTNDKEGSA